ncbi:hypothetical protein L2E82_36864 [Cichorium intybus]|uniref:Uncharacterized protein n=1 Tax=Cichorium intybus TaxID=13427 RepID=A0ACB9AEY5_CICIN|nr:hypothetical protein L2E82_36864 [Cichorium intybus]
MSILKCFLLVLILPYSDSLNFSFPNISNNDFHEILIAEAASLSDRGIQVTPERNDKQESSRAGRAIYFSPFHLWNKTSGELASFSTSFSFVIDSNFSTQYGDGLTFFLAESKYQINGGGAMGLPFDITTNLTISQFVAVEFDTFPNGWDPVDSNTHAPIGDHVGINVNSLTSVSFLKWWSNITYGRECQAWIDYDSFSATKRTLSVSFTGFQNNIVVRQVGLNHTIDLRDELPEEVIFGFSAATVPCLRKTM